MENRSKIGIFASNKRTLLFYMTETKPLILITNDDGYRAKGIAQLTEIMQSFGEVVVVAPDSPRSAQSSALTTQIPLRATKHQVSDNLTYYLCNGTPVDCIKLAVNKLVPRKPDLIVSGINHGSNAGISVVYSGTMGAAIEGCICHIPSVGFSLCDHSPNADFQHTIKYIKQIVRDVLNHGLPNGVCLNVNFPTGEIKGIEVASQTDGRWVKEFQESTDGIGSPVYWITGHFENREPDNKQSDEWLLAHQFASVVPVKVDMTAYDFISVLSKRIAQE